MLHNNGPFGPNDVPVNVNPQANMTDLSGQMNVGHNINNFGKIVQPPHHPTNTHFNLPDYVNYGLNMNSTLSPFHNFHQVNYQQNLMSQNSLQDSWQQNPLPMNLNTQNDHSAHSYYDKKFESQHDFSHTYNKNMLNIPQVYPKQYKHFGMESYPQYNHGMNNFNQYFDHNLDLRLKSQKPTDLRHFSDISLDLQKPQKPIQHVEQVDLSMHRRQEETQKSYEAIRSYTATEPIIRGNLDLSLKQSNLDLSHNSNLKSDKAKEIPNYGNLSYTMPEKNLAYAPIDQNLDLTTKPQRSDQAPTENADKPVMDQARRRNLANTVKMIEDILNHTTIAKKKELESQESKSISEISDGEREASNSKIKSTEAGSKIDENSTRLSEKSFEDSNSKIEEIFPSDDEMSNVSTEESMKSQTKDLEQDTAKTHDVLLNAIKEEYSSDSDCSDESDEDYQQKINHGSVVVKIEIPADLDAEYINPFQKDSSGIQKEDVQVSNVHDSKESVNIAKDRIKNGTITNTEYFGCPVCNMYFNNPKRFLIHIKWHSFGLTNEKRLEIQKAKDMRKLMQKEARVLERIKKDEVTEAESPDGKKYNCKECDKVFCKKSSLKNHQQRYHPSKHRECKICGKVLIGWIELRDHHQTHVSEAGYQCNDCPKRFKYSHSLAKHRDTHLEKTHGCPQCPKKFGSAALLNVHSKTHERMLRGATFRCTYCGKGFFESYHLQAHERTHRNERPFVCEICKTTFGTNSGLKRHLKVSHSTSKPYECSICHRSFISEAIRDRHELRNHGNPEDFKFLCKQCPCRYMKLKDLRKHVYKVHPKGKRKKKEESDSE